MYLMAPKSTWTQDVEVQEFCADHGLVLHSLTSMFPLMTAAPQLFMSALHMIADPGA